MIRRSARLAKTSENSYTFRQKPAPRQSTAKEGRISKARKQNKEALNQLETYRVPSALDANLGLAHVLPRKYDPRKAWDYVKSADPKLSSVMDEAAFNEFRLRIELADGSNPFKALVTSIIYQQIHGKAAASIRNKFIRLFDSPVPFPDDTLILPSSFPWFPTPELILSKSFEELRSAGLSQRKTEYICDLSTKFLRKSIVEEELDQMSDEDISKLLCSVKGIGQNARFLMFNLCHPDVLPVTDLGVRKGVALHFNDGSKKDKTAKVALPSAHEMRQLTNIWSPYRTVGSWLMWRIQEIKTVVD
ncbi:hypothetical protein [Absidia glauca]|uniref:HhH-GPD domain-containing protein n=1 Tax=Absidia glauca TaxID=4829 RepID=A0A163LUP8_ABSGL|nr:hypothetical protein [Absidia glauca]